MFPHQMFPSLPRALDYSTHFGLSKTGCRLGSDWPFPTGLALASSSSTNSSVNSTFP